MSLITRISYILIALIVTFVVLVFMVQLLSPLNSDETVSRSMALEISSIINAMLDAPPSTVRNYTLPARPCSVSFTKSAVNVTAGNFSFASPYLIPEYPFDIEVKDNIICDTGARIPFSFIRIGATGNSPDKIVISLPEE
jgi:hypothetical protein